jgi:NADH-quinone oxidoreductase subunit N
MSGIVTYLIIAITIHVTHNAIFNGAYSRELGIVTLGAGLLLTDSTIVAIILVSALIVLIISKLDEETITLFLLGVTGLIILSGTDSLLILFLSIELVGLTFYILAARERKGVRSTEAGVKYFVLGALSSGILLLGMSLAYATTGTTSLEMVTGASATMIKIGLLFKLGAAPFHM